MNAPLTRDQQIEMIERADERDAARIARWKKDSVISKGLTSRAVENGSTHVTHSRSDKIVACG